MIEKKEEETGDSPWELFLFVPCIETQEFCEQSLRAVRPVYWRPAEWGTLYYLLQIGSFTYLTENESSVPLSISKTNDLIHSLTETHFKHWLWEVSLDFLKKIVLERNRKDRTCSAQMVHLGNFHRTTGEHSASAVWSWVLGLAWWNLRVYIMEEAMYKGS